MNKQYQELFQLVARNGALNAEKCIEVMQSDKDKDHTKEIETMIAARDNFNVIEDKLLNGKDDLNLSEYIRLYAGAVVTRNLMEKNINTWTAVVKEYDENLIPKLYEVSKEVDDDKRAAIIDEYFN